MDKGKIRKYIYLLLIFLPVLFFIPSFLVFIKDFLVDYLWFQSIGFLYRYLLVFKIQIITFLIFFSIAFSLILFNNFITRYNIKNNVKKVRTSYFLITNYKITFIFILLFALIFSLTSTFWWEEILQFSHAEKFNISDPIFNNDLSFYVFKIELFKLVLTWILLLLLLMFIWSVFYYFYTGAISLVRLAFYLPQKIRIHLGIILCLIFINLGFLVFMQKYALLFHQGSIIKGAAYTDVYARIFAYNLVGIGLIIIGAIFLYSAIKKHYYPLLIAGITLTIVMIIFFAIYPFFLQQLFVAPNELEKETPFIKHTIKFTRQAYKIDNAQKINFNVKNDLDIKRMNKDIINNIRLWDWRPLRSTFKQLQEIRPYYIFSEIDVDRYVINGKLREVMLAVREISHLNLPRAARNWINRYLKYTHGYGLVMMPVNVKNDEGLPYFFVKDIPPVSIIDKKITRPEIYYGETVRDYVIVNTKTKEFDYPSGDGNVKSIYKGKGGIILNSFWKKLIMAVELSDFKMIFSNLITKETKVKIRRNIIEIVKKLVPFLLIDNDPYIVLINGKIYWFLDAYTYTDKYPYSEMYQDNYNYIRNSVKIIIDAYSGTVSLYIVDKKDPIIKVYQKIFPGLFKDGDKLPDEFKAHFRYPDDLFMTQSEIYRSYHMTDPEVFYNKEDLWDIPVEIYNDVEVLMNSYYVVNKIKGEEDFEFLNMIPFTPTKRDNMIGILMARCDPPHYGKLAVYKFSKKKSIRGPLQVESLIDQNVEISKLITLWGQKGSRVVRGNIFVIPIENSIIYVEPLFIYAEKKELPELKRIIVFYNNNIAVSANLEDAITTVLKGKSSSIALSDEIMNDLIDRINVYINEAQKSLEKKDYSGSQKAIKRIKSLLNSSKQ